MATVTEAARVYAAAYSEAYQAFYAVHAERREIGAKTATRGADRCATFLAGRVMNARFSEDAFRALEIAGVQDAADEE